MKNFELESIIDKKLFVNNCQDIVPNGLQIEGQQIITKIITGVTACQALLDQAVMHNANAIIVHHGYFWKNESQYIHNMQRKRLKTILENNINLYSWHLPLDIHPEIGNNAQIAKKLNICIKGNILPYVLWGNLFQKMTGLELAKKIEKNYCRYPIHIYENAPSYINRIAWCSGKGQNFIKNAYKFKIDAFITGEISEETTHIARELGIHFFSLGHHATEKDGIQSLSAWLNQTYQLNVTFIDIYNPA